MKKVTYNRMRCIGCLLLWLMSCLPQLLSAQSIADLARKADVANNPLHAYSYVGNFEYGVAIVGKENYDGDTYTGMLYGLANEDGTVVTTPKYDNMSYITNQKGTSIYLCSRDHRFGFINSNGEEFVPCQYSKMDQISVGHDVWSKLGSKTLWKVRRNNKYGILLLINPKEASLTVPCIYTELKYKNGFFYATKDGKNGVLDFNGKTVIPVENNTVYDFSVKGLAWVMNNSLFGIYNTNGEEIQTCDISKLFFEKSDGTRLDIDFGKYPGWSADYIYTERPSGIGVIEGSTCKTLIPSTHGYLSPIIKGKALFMDNGKWGVIGKSNNIIQDASFDEMDIAGQHVQPYKVPAQLFEDNIYVRKNFLWGMLNAEGELAVEVKYDSLGQWHDSLMVAKQNGKYGYIGIHGNVAIPFQFSFAADFSEGLAAVQNEKDKVFFIDTTGKIAIKPHKYDRVGQFTNGRCQVWHKDKTCFIDREGKKIKGATE